MASAADTAERIIGRFYSHFILRDLTFVISGAIVITATGLYPLNMFKVSFDSTVKLNWFAFLAFLAVSYVLGVILQEAARLPLEPGSQIYICVREWIKACWERGIQPKQWPNCWSNRTTLAKHNLNTELVVNTEIILRRGYTEHTINGIERVLFLKQVAATQLSALVAVSWLKGGISLAGSFLPRYGSAVIILGIVLCVWMYLDKSYQQEKILCSLLQLEEGLKPPVSEKVLMKVENLEIRLRESWWHRLFKKSSLK